MTAFANARHYYDVRKISAKKQEKTLDASSKALRSAEMKIRREMKETTVSMAINKIRKPFWFEKFQWFISTENYLVIGGRDAQQNEYLVKRHLRKGDVYVHADITGSR
jgi:predicted ribosome quality control (RQC) complex YloA/Tae2 family protein